MKHYRTHKRRHHSKRKTSRRVHRRRTHRRGGRAIPLICEQLRDRLDTMRNELPQQSANTIEDFVGSVRALYDEASRAGCPQELLNDIEEFENGPVMERTGQLLGH